MFEEINKYVLKCADLNLDELAYFNTLLKSKIVPKKTFLLKAGSICDFEAFIVHGCIKSYLLDQNGTEVILTFGIENWWISDITSFHEQSMSQMYIETIEDSELLLLNPTSKNQLLEKIPKFEKVFRLMLQRHLASYQERIFGNIAISAQDRYLTFLKKYPIISQRVPQHLIASYLGMSPEFLSKIRARLAKK